MTQRTELLDRYTALNAATGNPFMWPLTTRGFYSEVNNVLNAVMTGLMTKRRLIVDESGFNGLRWDDFFHAGLPLATADELARRDEFEYLGDVLDPSFKAAMRPVRRRHSFMIPLWFPQLGVFGSVFQVKRRIVETFAKPRDTFAVPPGLQEPFAAFHVRRGDKTNGFHAADGTFVIEGEATPLSTYLEVLDRKAPDIKTIFLMSDDWHIYDELAKLAAPRRIVTLAKPSETGYEQVKFDALSRDDKVRNIKRLIEETAIAAQSEIFVGGFRSNVARYVPLIHPKPGNCFSIDSIRKWSPR